MQDFNPLLTRACKWSFLKRNTQNSVLGSNVTLLI
jgi:hypothetical protein